MDLESAPLLVVTAATAQSRACPPNQSTKETSASHLSRMTGGLMIWRWQRQQINELLQDKTGVDVAGPLTMLIDMPPAGDVLMNGPCKLACRSRAS